MLTKTNLSLLLFFTISLFVASQCNEYTDPDEDLHRCQLRCARPLQPFRQQAACEQRCLEQYKGRREPEREDPRRQLEKCQRQCVEEQQGQRHQEYCQRQCEEAYGERQRETEESEYPQVEEEPRRQYEQCQSLCERLEGHRQKLQCRRRCKEQYEEQRGGGGGSTENHHRHRREKEQQEQNPYYFEGQRFESKFETQEGHFRVLERFSKRSELLQGIDNYRLAILEANPRTFMVPHHCDADAVFSVVRGQATISFVLQNKRESYNLQRGDIIHVPAGSTVYLINQDDNEKLQILMLVHPINTPGRFEEYFGVGGENPESFYRVFSNEVLEAAFNTRRDRLDRLFGQQKKGVFVKASEEQIRALSQEAGASRERQLRGPYNLLKERPMFSTRFGKFFEASPDDYEQLKSIDASVAFMNIKEGGMIVPYYNSRSTKMVYVAKGSGHFEMACPHLARQSQGSQGRRHEEEQEMKGVHYQKVTARLSVGDLFIIPAGHPITIIASQNEDLQLVGFGIKAQNNQKNFLAGRGNIWEHVESEAKELSFQVPSREVDEILRSQEESHFVAGPGKREGKEQGMDHYVASVLDFAGFL